MNEKMTTTWGWGWPDGTAVDSRKPNWEPKGYTYETIYTPIPVINDLLSQFEKGKAEGINSVLDQLRELFPDAESVSEVIKLIKASSAYKEARAKARVAVLEAQNAVLMARLSMLQDQHEYRLENKDGDIVFMGPVKIEGSKLEGCTIHINNEFGGAALQVKYGGEEKSVISHNSFHCNGGTSAIEGVL